MSGGSLLRSSLRYFWRTNLAVASGVAVAVGVLAGALLVGDSVRGSLLDLFLTRLGKTDRVVTSTGFFGESLASALAPEAAPLVALEGMVTNERTGLRRARVQVYAVDGRFWAFHDAVDPELSGRDVLVTESLAAELGSEEGDAILLRLERPSEVSRGSIHGSKEDAARTIRLSAREGLEATGLPEFSIYPTQESVFAVFVPLDRIQRDLDRRNRVNAVLLATGEMEDAVAALRSSATLDDLSLRVRPVEGGAALAVESEALMLSDSVAEAVRDSAAELDLEETSFFTYLANTLRVGESEIPYSLVTAVEEPRYRSEFLGGSQPSPDSIVLNDWAGGDLGAKPGDRLTMEFYLWEDEGRIVTRSTELTVDAIVPMEALAADRELAPEYPGISETESLADWEPPFPIDLRRVRAEDEDYWDRYRTTPKAFLPLAQGQELWPVREGQLTSIRLQTEEGIDRESFESALRRRLDPIELGFTVIPAREEGLRAARGATDFGEYFVYFSYFLVMAAVLLTGLFFKLGVEQRHREVGTLLAMGFTPASVRRIFLAEGFALALLGSLAGILVAIGYAWLVLYGLRTWWVDAVGTRLLTLHASGTSFLLGIAGGIAAALLATWLTLRHLGKIPPRSLLAGEIAPWEPRSSGRSRRAVLLGTIALAGSLALVAGAAASVVSDLLGFFGAGNLFLVALLCFQWAWLKSGVTRAVAGTGIAAVGRLGFRNAAYRPGRSLVAIALIAFATFTIVAVDAFRKGEVVSDSATGGFLLMAESLVPLHWDPNTGEGRNAFNLPYPGDPDAVEMTLQPFRLRPGEDASCLNLYRPQNPRILAPRGDFLEGAGFRFADSLAETPEEKANPWLLLEKELPDGAVPFIGDRNSMNYVLHLGLGEDFLLARAGEQPLRLRLVATLADSIFQSELLVSEESFLRHFPRVTGFRFFLVDVEEEKAADAASLLEERLSDFGLDVSSTAERLASFHRVENTYLSTFQSLGGLGLLLGTLGLTAVLLRNVLERRRELALLRAVGYRARDFSWMILSENALLLVLGLATGALSALVAIAPALVERGGSPGGPGLFVLLALVLAGGMVSSLLAVGAALRAPVLASLRAE